MVEDDKTKDIFRITIRITKSSVDEFKVRAWCVIIISSCFIVQLHRQEGTLRHELHDQAGREGGGEVSTLRLRQIFHER